MTAVFNTLVDSNDQPLAGKLVRLELITPGFVDTDQAEIVRVAYATTDDSGLYTFTDVEPNGSIDPANTYYLVHEPGVLSGWPISVPGSGSHWVKTLLIDAPPTPSPIAAGIQSVVAGTNITVDNTDPSNPVISANSGSTPIVYTLSAVSNWTQAHAFPYPPNVRLIDATNVDVGAEVHYPDPTHVNLTFPTPFTGTAVLS